MTGPEPQPAAAPAPETPAAPAPAPTPVDVIHPASSGSEIEAALKWLRDEIAALRAKL